MNWTEISLEINADDIDKAAAIANMTVPSEYTSRITEISKRKPGRLQISTSLMKSC